MDCEITGLSRNCQVVYVRINYQVSQAWNQRTGFLFLSNFRPHSCNILLLPHCELAETPHGVLRATELRFETD